LKICPEKNIIAVLGQMRELGRYSHKMHRDAGAFLAGLKNIKYILAGGKYSSSLLSGAAKKGFPEKRMFEYDNNREAASIIKKINDEDSIAVIKASRRERLEEVMEYLKE